jgi:hypothetical protein
MSFRRKHIYEEQAAKFLLRPCCTQEVAARRDERYQNQKRTFPSKSPAETYGPKKKK